jgi:hypothetical protein
MLLGLGVMVRRKADLALLVLSRFVISAHHTSAARLGRTDSKKAEITRSEMENPNQ